MTINRKLIPAAFAALLASCGIATAGGDTLRVGALVPSSGPVVLIGGPMEKGARVLYEQLEKTGLGGRKVKFTIYDTEGKPPNAVQLFRRLVDNDEVDVVIGPLTSGEALAVSPAANEAKVPVIAFGAAEAMTKPVTPYLFGLAPVDAVVIADLLNFMTERKMKRVALIYSTDGFGQSGGKILQETAAAKGIELVDVETFAGADTDMTPQLLNIRSKNPDAVVMWTATNPAPTIIMKTAKTLGITAPFVLSYGQGYNTFLQQAGDVAEGAFVVGLPVLAPEALPDSDGRKAPIVAFAKDYQARWGSPPDQSSGGMMDTKLILEEALKKIQGPITRENLRDAIETVKMCGSYGCRQYSATDHRGHDKNSIVMLKIQGGKWVAIDK